MCPNSFPNFSRSATARVKLKSGNIVSSTEKKPSSPTEMSFSRAILRPQRDGTFFNDSPFHAAKENRQAHWPKFADT